MRKHEGYSEIQLGEPNGDQKEIPHEDAGKEAGQEVLKKRGRPRKEAVSIFD
jgi:hypothetical protein